MGNSHYQSLEVLISEYEEDSKSFQAERQIMINYPKVFIMSTASSFEHYIKQDIDQFISNPIQPMDSNYPNLVTIRASAVSTGISASDKLYKKFYTFNPAGVIDLNAEEFYRFFEGSTFKEDLEANFGTIHSRGIEVLDRLISGLAEGDNPLIYQKEQYMIDYIKYDDIKNLIDTCTFSMAEEAFLELKLRRNRVAHNYLVGLSDTFGDLIQFYYKAILYVVALEATLKQHTVDS